MPAPVWGQILSGPDGHYREAVIPALPDEFWSRAERSASWARWLQGLPRLMSDVVAEWQLTPDGEVWTGHNAAVLGMTTATGERAALKLGWPHGEAEHEHLALRTWAGAGAVRLLRADPRRWLLLLERAEPGNDLNCLPVTEACEIIAELYARLHQPPIPQLDRLSVHAARWADRLPELRDGHQVPRRFVDQAIGLAADFATDPATDRALIHSDLHFGNVLAAEREPWLVIDPKPLAGDPAYEVAPLLWNRWAEAVAGGGVRHALLDRLFTVVDGAGLDEDRVRDWVVVREVVRVWWATRDGAPGPDPELVTRATTILKAVQR